MKKMIRKIKNCERCKQRREKLRDMINRARGAKEQK